MMKTATPEPHAPCLPDSIRQTQPCFPLLLRPVEELAPGEEEGFLGPSFPGVGGSRISRWEGLEEGPERRTLDDCGTVEEGVPHPGPCSRPAIVV